MAAVVLSLVLCASSKGTPAATCVQAPPGLAGWWPGDSSGADLVGGNDASIIGGGGFTTGKVGDAFNLGQAGQYVKMAASAQMNVATADGFTLETWVNPSSLGQSPILEWNTGGNGTPFGVHLYLSVPLPSGTGAGCLYANIVDSTGGYHTLTSGPGLVQIGQFQHVALTYIKATGATVLYLNGSPVAQQTFGTFIPQTSYDFLVGYRPQGPLAFQGIVDEVSLYRRALSGSEIAALFQADSAGKCHTITPASGAPAISQPPANVNAAAGDDVTLSVVASGNQPLTYQWRRDGVILPGATASTLSFSRVRGSDAGSYTVVISNDQGTTISAPGALTVSGELPCLEPALDLVSLWRGDLSGQDETGRNHAALLGGVGFGPGEVGEAFSYTVDGNRVSAPASSSLDVGAKPGFTIEAWVNPSSLSGQRPLLEWDVTGKYGVHVYLSVIPPYGGGAGCVFANLADANGSFHPFSSPGGVLQESIWQHLALTYNKVSGSAVLYINGTVVGSSNLGTFTPLTAGNLLIGFGRVSGSELTYNGLIDEVGLYSRALSASEVAAIHEAGALGKCALGPPHPPTLANIPDVTTDEDLPVTVALQVSDAETSAANLSLSFASSDATLLPLENIVVGGGNSPHITLTPAANRSGTVTVTVTVTDPSGLTASDSFQLIVNPVNDPPSISTIGEQFITVNSALGPVAFQIGDLDSPINSLSVEAASSNKSLVPDASITLSGTGANRSLSLQPAAGQSGSTVITLTVSDGAATAVSAFQLIVGASSPRALRVVGATGMRGLDVAVPIELIAQGNENALGFSLSYDPVLLTSPRVATSLAGAQLNANLSQTGSGQVGIALALPTGQALTPGTREIVRVTWQIIAPLAVDSVTVSFGDQPVTREVADNSANPLQTTYQGGVITVQPGFEADVAPRQNGSGTVSLADWVQVGRFAAGLDVAGATEFVRADCAPRLNGAQLALGNGLITVSDWVQAGRYAAGLDPITPAGGPAGPLAPGGAASEPETVEQTPAATRTVRVLDNTLAIGQSTPVRIEIESDGTVNAVGFSVQYNPAFLRFLSAAVVGGAQTAALNVNASQAASGQIGVALALSAGQSIPTGTSALVDLTFEALIPGPVAVSLTFADQPIGRELVSPSAENLTASFIGGTMTLPDPPDTDNDGLPDFWETAHGLQAGDPNDASEDPDGDGLTNLEEYVAGTDPQDSSSRLRVSSVQASGANVQVSFSTIVGKEYELEVSDQFPVTQWNSVANLTGSGAVMQFTDAGAALLAKRYYRITCTDFAKEAHSQTCGLFEIQLSAGANFLSSPLHPLDSYRGVLSAVSGSTLTVDGSPGWQAGQFASQNGSYQFMALLRKDTSASPGYEGEWWFVSGNTANTLTVNTRGANLSTILAGGDQIEIRPLTSILNLFGGAGSLVLIPDANGFASPAEEDLIRCVSGTSFSREVFWHDGTLAPAGYYVDGDGPFDGSTITLAPDEAVMAFRKSGAGSARLLLLGQPQTTRLAHYLQPGANPIGTGFAAPAALATSGLLQVPWTSDSNGFANRTEEDLLRTVQGTGFDREVFHHNGALADPGWYVNGELDNTFSLQPGKGYFLFMKGPGSVTWRQSVP